MQLPTRPLAVPLFSGVHGRPHATAGNGHVMNRLIVMSKTSRYGVVQQPHLKLRRHRVSTSPLLSLFLIFFIYESTARKVTCRGAVFSGKPCIPSGPASCETQHRPVRGSSITIGLYSRVLCLGCHSTGSIIRTRAS